MSAVKKGRSLSTGKSRIIGEDAGTIEDVYEPYLIKNGFLNRTPRGRVVTDLVYRHFGLEIPG